MPDVNRFQNKHRKERVIMLKKRKSTHDSTSAITEEELLRLQEKERLDSVFPEAPASKKALTNVWIYLITAGSSCVILTLLYYAGLLIGNIRYEAVGYLGMIDDSAGFLSDTVTALLHILLFIIIAVLLGIALNINYSVHGRPNEVLGKYKKFILLASFGSCAAYVLIHHLAVGRSFSLSGSLLSKSLYYVSMLTVVPVANILLYLVLPLALIRMLLTLVSETKQKAELPLIIAGTVIMTLGLLGINPANIENFGLEITLFTLVQSAACSLLYLKTNVIWSTVLLYSGVSGLYFILTALLNLI